jgi:predicted aspartyl protease
LRLIHITLFIFFALDLTCQSFSQTILDGKEKFKIKYRPVQGFIVIDVLYGGLIPLSFIFDTGAKNTIIFEREIAELLPIKYDKTVLMMGADLNEEIRAFIARKVFLNIGGSPIIEKDIVVLEQNKMQLNEVIGEEIHGILGADILNGLIVQIDYYRNEIVFFNNANFKREKLNEYSEIGARFDKGKIFLNSYILDENRDTVNLNLLFDTGASITTLLHNNTSEKIKLPSHYINGNLGKGISGDVTGFIGRLDELGIKPYKFSNLIGYYQNYNMQYFDRLAIADRNGLLGNIILDRFNIIIDYVKEKIYFKPNKRFKKEIHYDRSGLILLAQGKKFEQIIIHEVLQGSPAEDAGIMKGDRILKVKWYNFGSLNLEYLSKLLSGKVGKIVNLQLLREGKKINRKIILRDLI